MKAFAIMKMSVKRATIVRVVKELNVQMGITVQKEVVNQVVQS